MKFLDNLHATRRFVRITKSINPQTIRGKLTEWANKYPQIKDLTCACVHEYCLANLVLLLGSHERTNHIPNFSSLCNRNRKKGTYPIEAQTDIIIPWGSQPFPQYFTVFAKYWIKFRDDKNVKKRCVRCVRCVRQHNNNNLHHQQTTSHRTITSKHPKWLTAPARFFINSCCACTMRS